ncbi:MAG: PIN domain-containing protein [Terrimicrobiaceae bacterium]
MTPILVDTSVYIDHLRAGEDIRQLLMPFLRAGLLFNCGVIRAEVLRGMKSPAARDGMLGFFDIVPEVPCDARLWHTVSLMGWQLGRNGKWPPVTDLAIAASALRSGCRLISPDHHFQDIPGLIVLANLPEI